MRIELSAATAIPSSFVLSAEFGETIFKPRPCACAWNSVEREPTPKLIEPAFDAATIAGVLARTTGFTFNPAFLKKPWWIAT